MKRCAPQNPAPSYFESVPILQQLASYTVTLQARKKAERPGDTNGNTLIRWRFIYRDNKRRKKKGTVIPHVHTVIWLEEESEERQKRASREVLQCHQREWRIWISDYFVRVAMQCRYFSSQSTPQNPLRLFRHFMKCGMNCRDKSLICSFSISIRRTTCLQRDKVNLS